MGMGKIVCFFILIDHGLDCTCLWSRQA